MRTFLWQAFVLTGCIALSAYFTYHTVSGRYGLHAREQLLTRATALDFETEALNKAVSKLTGDIALLGPEPPAPDIVDEIARDLLGYTHPRDRIIMLR
ncbi:MAG: septum formation initiator family protein [Alphaproteobacteria bacterium]|nr:septum formation initiator family protein [Alphaproteobacteria bacterium]